MSHFVDGGFAKTFDTNLFPLLPSLPSKEVLQEGLCYNDSVLTKGSIMQVVFYSQARNNLRSMINQVCENFEEFVITTKEKQSVMLISQDEYNSMKETIYLLSSKDNRDRLLDAVDQIESAQFVKKEIDL